MSNQERKPIDLSVEPHPVPESTDMGGPGDEQDAGGSPACVEGTNSGCDCTCAPSSACSSPIDDECDQGQQ